jgi:hypothetical protein
LGVGTLPSGNGELLISRYDLGAHSRHMRNTPVIRFISPQALGEDGAEGSDRLGRSLHSAQSLPSVRLGMPHLRTLVLSGTFSASLSGSNASGGSAIYSLALGACDPVGVVLNEYAWPFLGLIVLLITHLLGPCEWLIRRRFWISSMPAEYVKMLSKLSGKDAARDAGNSAVSTSEGPPLGLCTRAAILYALWLAQAPLDSLCSMREFGTVYYVFFFFFLRFPLFPLIASV